MNLLGAEIVPVPDDDKRMQDVQPGAVGWDGRRFFVRESEWPALLEKLRGETLAPAQCSYGKFRY